MIEWFSYKNKTNYVSIDTKSITFSIGHKEILETAYGAMLGIDKNKSEIYIKILNSDEANRGDIDNSLINHISVGRSYCRITNKGFVQLLIDENLIDLKDGKSIKFKSNIDERNHLIIVGLKEALV